MRVDQVLCAAGPVDAVTGQALAYRRLMRGWGFSGEDYAPVQAPGMPAGAIRPLHALRPERSDVLVVHYSGYASGVEALVGRARSLLVFHNITPAHYFWATDPVEAVRCQLGRGQLAEVSARATALAGVSEFNAAELRAASGREAAVLPVLFSPPPVSGSPAAPSDPLVLFVGRLTPHKRQDLVIRAFARWRTRTGRDAARLVLVGTPLSPDFARQLEELAQELAPGAVRFGAGLGPSEVWDLYQRASAFLCLSEHEGFCIPLLEAFHFGVPVVARAAGAVGEVAGPAAVLLEDRDGTAVAAELLELVHADRELRGELIARGRRRLEERYAFQDVAASVRAALEAVAGGGAR